MRSKHIVTVLSVIAALAAVAVVVSAGNPNTPPGPPETTSSYTLEHIYDRLSTGAAGAQITFTEPISGPTVGTGHTLDEIMAVVPQVDDTNGATASQVVSGTTYWGLTSGEWGLQNGAATAGSNVTGGEGQLTFAIPDGFYTGSKTATAQDTDLVAGNIVQGVDLFGVDGSAVEASGNATDTQVLDGVTYSNASGASTGTMTNNGGGSIITPTTTNQNVAAGYWSSANTVQGDADLTAGNIKQGVTLFGVDGTLYNAAVPKTGQTISYTVGDDGDLEMGVDWITSTRFITGTTGVVTDTLTGLIWLENANCWGQQNWATAIVSATALSSGECGLSDGSSAGDWRLPNVRELQSLIDYGEYNPALPDGHPFTGVLVQYYWSSTTCVDGTGVAWYVALSGGYMHSGNKTSSYRVWPVRGGQ